MITVYTDGSCLGNPGPWGRAALFLKEEKVLRLEGGEPNTTNNKMELTAVVEALSYIYVKKTGHTPLRSEHEGAWLFERTPVLHGTVDEKVVFFMDSEYVRKGISDYLAVRRTNNRKTARKKPIQHQSLRQRLQCLLECFVDIQRHRVEGHSGDPYNDAVDQRARKQARLQKKNI